MSQQRPPLGLPPPSDVPRPWADDYPPGVPASYAYPDVGVTRFLDDAARDFPQRVALRFLGTDVTYQELLDDTDRLAHALVDLGLGKGDRLGLVLPNCPQHVVALFAAWRLGVVVAEHDPSSDARELAEQIEDAGCRAVLVADGTGLDLGVLRARAPGVRSWVVTGLSDALPLHRRVVASVRARRRRRAAPFTVRYRDLLRGRPLAVEPVELDPVNDLAVLVRPTGAREGRPAIMLTHANLVANAFQIRLWIPDTRAGDEAVLAALPFFRADGLTACVTFGVLVGATLVVLPDFETQPALRAMARNRVTLFPGVTGMFDGLARVEDRGRHDLSALRVCLLHGPALAPEAAESFENWTGARLRWCYGRPEAALLLLANPVYGRTRPGTVGVPLPDTVAVVVDPDGGGPVPAGEPGALAVAGPQVMAGYWRRPDLTGEALTGQWLLTGDRGRMDREGFFTLEDVEQG